MMIGNKGEWSEIYALLKLLMKRFILVMRIRKKSPMLFCRLFPLSEKSRIILLNTPTTACRMKIKKSLFLSEKEKIIPFLLKRFRIKQQSCSMK